MSARALSKRQDKSETVYEQKGMAEKAAFSAYDPQAAVDFVIEQEGLETAAYQCSAGRWTIGVGHTGTVTMNGRAVAVCRGMTITEAQAREILRDDLQNFRDKMAGVVTALVSESQFVALLSFTFNVGFTAFRGSSLLAKLNAGQYSAAADEFLRWKYIGKAVSAGLLARRQRERALFLSEEQR